MDRPFERVYTVHDFYDGPRAGFADLDGRPHAYRSIWRDDLDDWDPDERFELTPITDEELALVLEDWAIWRRWEEAFHAGRATHDTHPALPEDRARHDELWPQVERALRIDPARRCVAAGAFRSRDGSPRALGVPTSRIPLVVRWTPIE